MSPRVLFVAPSAYTTGGIATWLESIDSGLRDRDWQPIVGLVEGPRYHRPGRYLEKHFHKETVSILCFSGTVEGRLRAMMNAIRRVQPDLIVTVNIPDALNAMLYLRKEKQTNSRIAMTLHAFQEDLYQDVKRYKSVLDGVVCTNRLAAKLAERTGGIHSARVHYAPSGTKIGEYHCPVLQDRLRIAFVGRLDQNQKRILDIPDILKNLDVPFEILVAGEGPDERLLTDKLQPFVANGSARFLGKLDQAELEKKVYSKSNVLLITSPSESGPLVAWEAMAHGLVVLTSNYVGSGLEAALCHGENALMFAVGETKAAAKQLSGLWDQPARFQHLSKSGYSLVKQRYCNEASVLSWDEALQRVLGSESLPLSDVNTPDRSIGSMFSESLRSFLMRQGPDSGPGGEWPHSHSGVTEQSEFLARITSIDQEKL